ncbi:CesT family type III secretion system chaperone [Paludibacterium purpuratum]|uniref:Tir chaperone family protein CesT n=1 Tax=Paludibacterium purpuratum TaxID=1144873 RepID=A0A4R7B3F1_9NEIS|nr:CesT family type III secretion system chaperone [Paludibacterium purpuratum]TDR76704.1 Tir chaperone family protein CesT [Paludibacterium purpuratum]
MRDLSEFHRRASELLHHLGFDMPVPASDQDVISLAIDQRFTVHLGCIDDDHWFIQADLGIAVIDDPTTQLAWALRGNQLAASPWLPVAALDTNDHLVCWLRLPVQGNDLPTVVAAFDMLVASAERLLEPATPLRRHDSPAPPYRQTP